MTNIKKRISIVCSVCAIVVIAVLVSLFIWKNTFGEEWIIGKTQNEIEQRYGDADFSKDNYIEYWTKQKFGYKINRIFFDDNNVAIAVLYDYTNGHPSNDTPDMQGITFNFNTYDKMLTAFLTYDTTQSSYHVQDYKLTLGDTYTNFLEKVESDRFIPQPMLDNVPIAYRNEDGFSNITFMTYEAYNMPWIWYHCVTNGENITVKITYPECVNNEIDYSKNCSEILKSIAPNAVNTDNFKEYSSYKNVYFKTIRVASGETSALIYELTDSDNIIVMFCYDNVLVSLNGKPSVINESFLENFSMSNDCEVTLC